MRKNEKEYKNMNKNKLIAYGRGIINSGIHTGNGTTSHVEDFDKANKSNLIESYIDRKDKNEIYMRINPNKNFHGYVVDSYSQFKEVVQDLFDEIGVEDFKWKRIDLSFNTMDCHYYENYTKLNRLLIACIADSVNDYNTHDTKNFWNGKTKSLVTKNGYREAEFYDKNDESNGKSPYFSRLELRSKRISESIEHEFLDLWFERLNKAAKHFEKVQHRFNRNMAQLYLEDLAKKKRDREFLSINSFLMTRKEYIFTSKQMKELLMMIGLSEEKAANKAYNFKKYHTIEYFKKEDLDYIIADIKEKIIDYFSK